MTMALHAVGFPGSSEWNGTVGGVGVGWVEISEMWNIYYSYTLYLLGLAALAAVVDALFSTSMSQF